MAIPLREQQALLSKEDIFKGSLEFLLMIFKQGGPNKKDYSEITKTCEVMNNLGLTLTQEKHLYDLMNPILTTESMIGFSYLKPHGYAGDFEQISRIYGKWKSKKTDMFHKWDNFYHNLAAATAVRNRKEYIQGVLKEIEGNDSPKVLNLGSGPCSDIKQYFSNNPESNIKFVCLDMDDKAIEFGKTECEEYLDKIEFVNANAFRYKTEVKFDLIWSAGMFDYFKDKLFIHLTKNYYKFVKPGGQLVIGNFAEGNESRGVMEIFGQWYLHHRSINHLKSLAKTAGVLASDISINSEKTGVNLFMHIKR